MTCSSSSTLPLPKWFRQPLPDPARIGLMKQMFRGRRLHTVCESAKCPNLGQCWGAGVATFMILGNVCSRACRFCAIQAGRPQTVDTEEPDHVARTVEQLRLRYVVITSVARDDLPDEGAEHFAATIRAVRERNPQTGIEVLIPDFSARPECLHKVVEAKPEVISHNVETVHRLTARVRPQARYGRSLHVLSLIKSMNPALFTKSSLMVGLGETELEMVEAMDDLRRVGCDILTVGQYLAPTRLRRHLPVKEFISPEMFERYEHIGRAMGFKHVMSGPLVRSSYIAERGYQECLGAQG